MSDVLADVARHLQDQSIPFCLIGAGALAVHGLSRATLDVDLFTTNKDVLKTDFWPSFPWKIDPRYGDTTDPLAGVVRVRESKDGEVVDVVVGRGGDWQHQLLEDATTGEYSSVPLPVVSPLGLVLLKLYAGGARDFWDIEGLLALHPQLADKLEGRVDSLPPFLVRQWKKLKRIRD